MCDKCPNCGSFQFVTKQHTPKVIDEKVIVDYDAFCTDCGATFVIQDIYVISEMVQYYNGEETVRNTW